LGWDARGTLAPLGNKAVVKDDLNELIEAISAVAKSGDQIW
jgi:UDP-N-acetylmuramate: L-alanyl-gamma-D-glutamyl-meso-diaminopimelate ligase